MSSAARPGRLFLIPTPLGAASEPQGVLPADTLAAVARLDCFVVENAKTARAFLKAAGTDKPLQALEMAELSEHTPAAAIPGLLAPLLAGRDLGLLSEAGCPAVADPGAALVAAAHEAGIEVVPLVGPSSLLLALMASGLNGQRFAFAGYLPAQPGGRVARLRELERRSGDGDETVLWIETPYRNRQVFEAALAVLSPETRLTVASQLTLGEQAVATRRVQDWRTAPPELPREPTVFAMLAPPGTGPRRTPGRAVSEATSPTPRRPAPGRGSRRR
ncbi:SAM-dependent methyltransferase [Zeimonas arvi]|uniref:SAM-dependent methyltransferase n=1 Tax=Zeimonas arvi TaxID=2498847 RepID=UPI001CEC93C5|nr:SAM-dependent methyltransferase [Zeimonas arvi]